MIRNCNHCAPGIHHNIDGGQGGDCRPIQRPLLPGLPGVEQITSQEQDMVRYEGPLLRSK